MMHKQKGGTFGHAAIQEGGKIAASVFYLSAS